MKAVIFTEHGGPEKLQLQNVVDPQPRFGEVVLQVKACALNHLDWWVLQGSPAYPVQRPHILGCDVAGIIESVGKDAEGVQVGQRVLVAPGLSCGACAMCQRGMDNLCENYSILGAKYPGGYAEKVVVPSRHIIPIPDSISFEEAAAFPLTFVTAWHMLSRARLQSGQTVLVVGASSGVGSAVVQIAKYKGAQVLASVTSDEKASVVRALGADAVVNSSKESIAHVARAWTKKRGVDIAVEHVGPATWEQSLGSVAPGGCLVTCGATTGPEVKIDLRYVFSREISILGSRMGTRAELDEIAKLVFAKDLRPVVSQTYPLAQAREALEALHARKHFGKIVLTI